MISELERLRNTKRFLTTISKHLSGRKDCRGVIYKVTIQPSYKDEEMIITPEIKIFPDRYHRKPTDKTNVIAHVLFKHMPEILLTSNGEMSKVYYTETLIPGVYEYQMSFSGKQRRWVKIS